MAVSKTMATARKFMAAARSAGWRVSSRENVVTITKGFTAESVDAEASRREFVELDGEYYGILSILPHKGSMWGTDGGGVGGYSAMLHGVFTMNVSGVSERMIDAIYAAWDELLEEEEAAEVAAG